MIFNKIRHVFTALPLQLSILILATAALQASPDIPVKAAQSDELQPNQCMRFLLKDGSQMLASPNGINIPIATEYGNFEIPLGSLRALKFIANAGDQGAKGVILRFHTGLIVRMKLHARRGYFKLQDSNGVRHKIYYSDIMGVISLTQFNNTSPEITPVSNATSYALARKDGTREKIKIPVITLKLKTGIGTLTIPSPSIYSIEYNAESGRYIVTTIFGEIITCKIATRKIAYTTADSSESNYLYLSDTAVLTMNAKIAPIPASWCVWQLSPEIAVIANFAGETNLKDENGIDVPADICNLASSVNGKFICPRKHGRPIVCTPSSRKVEISLFSFGQKISVPWKNVRKLSKAIPASYAELEHTVIQQNDGETIKTDFQENDTPTLKLKTCLGSLTISRQNISALYIDQKSSKACLIATDGSHFVVPRPSRRQLGDLTGVEDYELPEQNCFTVNISPRNSNPSGAGTFACRLDDGSLLYGKLASQEITLLHGKDGHQKSTINNTSIKSISRNEDGKLIFNLKRGALVADPKQKSLLFTIDACSTTNKIAFKHIRNLISSAAKLPPSTIFRPGLPAALKNEISVKGGSYMQGSSSGMDDEAPVHPVSLSSFLIDATEVTRAQFADFIRDTDYKTSAELSESPATWRIPGFMQNMNDPVVCVSWDDAVAYCNWRSSKAGLAPCYTVNKDKTVETDMTANGYRLPTEAEWEFAARSRGKDNLYACTTGTIEPAVLMANSKEVSSVDKWTWTNPVMAFPANQIGIYGMSGNAWEWCQDWYFSKAYASLQNREVHDPCIKSDDAPRLSRRVMRGGSFRNHREMLRCTSRGNGLPFAFAGHVGFRCVRNAPSSQ